MIDQNFHIKNGKFSLLEIVTDCGGEISDMAKQEDIITDIAPLNKAKEGEITFFQNKKYINDFKTTKASACITFEEFETEAPKGLILIKSKNPYYTYSKVLNKFYGTEQETVEAPHSANVNFSADIGENTKIYPGAYIGDNCTIGKNCTIYPNAVIQDAIIGDNVIIHPGVAIGQDGFGFAFNEGKHHKVLQLGRVIIGNDVEIGANTTIDRGSNSDTVIGEGTKIDNLVMIAHNVKIGKHCILVAQTGVAGSTEIGDYCVFGGQSAVAGHLKIGNQVQLAGQCGVTKSLPDGAIMGGTPAVPLREYHKQHIALNKLTKKK